MQTHRHKHTDAHTQMHTHRHKHTDAHTHKYILIHTHIHERTHARTPHPHMRVHECLEYIYRAYRYACKAALGTKSTYSKPYHTQAGAINKRRYEKLKSYDRACLKWKACSKSQL